MTQNKPKKEHPHWAILKKQMTQREWVYLHSLIKAYAHCKHLSPRQLVVTAVGNVKWKLCSLSRAVSVLKDLNENTVAEDVQLVIVTHLHLLDNQRRARLNSINQHLSENSNDPDQ